MIIDRYNHDRFIEPFDGEVAKLPEKFKYFGRNKNQDEYNLIK